MKGRKTFLFCSRWLLFEMRKIPAEIIVVQKNLLTHSRFLENNIKVDYKKTCFNIKQAFVALEPSVQTEMNKQALLPWELFRCSVISAPSLNYLALPWCVRPSSIYTCVRWKSYISPQGLNLSQERDCELLEIQTIWHRWFQIYVVFSMPTNSFNTICFF